MKVTNITNVNEFIEVIDCCEDKVEFVTEQGEHFDLTSKIAQFASIVKLVSNGSIPQIELILHNNRDVERMMRYMMNG